MTGHNAERSSPIEDSEVKQKLDEEVMVIHETDIVDEEVCKDDYEGHPSWYETMQCWRCNSLFMPSSEEATDYCDSCQVKIDQLSEDLQGPVQWFAHSVKSIQKFLQLSPQKFAKQEIVCYLLSLGALGWARTYNPSIQSC